jgi:hypothetical protein
MHESEYKRLKRKIQAEYDEKMKALDMIWGLSNTVRRKSSNDTETRGVGKGALLQAIREALPKLTGDFSAKDVEKQMKADNATFAATVKRASISSALNRLEEDYKEIVLVVKGRGKRSTTYRR